jgi:ABC-type amino acid transport system permease subunit
MSTILQVLGMAAVTLGVTLISITAGLIVGGLFLILAGIAVGRK